MTRAVGMLPAIVMVASACNVLFGVDDFGVEPNAPGTGGLAAQGGTGGVGGGGAADASGGAGAAGGFGGGGNGGAGEVLEDRGLVARYYIQEADRGSAPTELLDAGPSPLPLAITYAGMTYTEEATGRGLTFVSQNNGRASATLSPEKIALLDGSTQVTMEAVVSVVSPVVDFARVFQLAPPADGGGGFFAMRFRSASGKPSATFMDMSAGTDHTAEWDTSPVGAGRVIAHVVVDTTQPVVDDRVRYYLGGSLQAPTTMPTATIVPAAQNLALDPNGCDIVLGNRTAGERPLRGTLYYFALYAAALTQAEIDGNVLILTASDDAPN